ncbi:MAG: lectin-like protein [Pseudomonadota bacterium]
MQRHLPVHLVLATTLALGACAPADCLQDTGFEATAEGKGLTTGSGSTGDREAESSGTSATKPSGPYLLKWRYYRDQDGDGYGDPTVSLVSYGQPAGYVKDASDCDDSDPAVHPGAEERCNGLDDDCDDDIEELVSYGGHDYAFCHLPGEETDFATARARCQAFPQGMDLAVITTAEEQAFITSEWDGLRLDSTPIQNHRGNDEYVAWVGFTDQVVEDIWVWVDGYAHGYDAWCGGEPNDAAGEDCAVTGWTADYESGPTCGDGWNDLGCEIAVPFICETR